MNARLRELEGIVRIRIFNALERSLKLVTNRGQLRNAVFMAGLTDNVLAELKDILMIMEQQKQKIADLEAEMKKEGG